MATERLVSRFVNRNLVSPVRGVMKKYPAGFKRSLCIPESSDGETDMCSITETEDDSQSMASPGQGETATSRDHAISLFS